MKNEYITARLFKHNREADDLITKEELLDSDQQPWTVAPNISPENIETEIFRIPNKSSLPQSILGFMQTILTALTAKHKE